MNLFIILLSLVEIETLVGIFGGALGLIATIITLTIKLIKVVKSRKFAEFTLFLQEAAEEFVVAAEAIKNFQGKDKKEWVLTKINQAAIEAGYGRLFDPILVSEIIENVVAITKKVNQRDKDKEVSV